MVYSSVDHDGGMVVTSPGLGVIRLPLKFLMKEAGYFHNVEKMVLDAFRQAANQRRETKK